MRRSRRITYALIALTTVACGDPETNDDRGYTKAPLEHPTVVIKGEEPSEMSRLGDPNRVVATEIVLPEETPAAQPTQQPAQPTVALPEGVTAEMVTQGETLFGSGGNCFACHGQKGVAQPSVPR